MFIHLRQVHDADERLHILNESMRVSLVSGEKSR